MTSAEDYSTNEPPIIGRGYRILLNGERVRKVRAFDTEDGWVRVLCLDDHSGHGGRVHVDPNNPAEPCEKVLRGVVNVIRPKEQGQQDAAETSDA